jgi:hypothetical protein
VVAVLVARSFWKETPRFGPERFACLTIGMTQDEVEAVLGCPPGDYRPKSWRSVSMFDRWGMSDLRASRGRTCQDLREAEDQAFKARLQAGKPDQLPTWTNRQRWEAEDFGIDVVFGSGGTAIHCSLWELYPPRPPEDPYWIFRHWFGW